MLDETTLSAALVDVRHAYRLLWDFQKRVLDTIKFVSLQFPDRVFYQWQNNTATPTPAARIDPTRFWSWDFLPLHNASLIYTRDGDDRWHPSVGDWLLEIRLIVDSGYEVDDERVEPDPSRFASVEDSETSLSIIIFKCLEEVGENDNWFRHVWGKASWPSEIEDADDEGVTCIEEGSLVACQIDIPLAKLVNKEAVKAFCDRAKRAFSGRLDIDFTADGASRKQ